ncbi:lysozyme [Bradyrhizobium sp.]|uniref:lysozyme n=1 Tax=Bradyrhizobium sp. TaxID=376 RepID=UPI002D2B6245|nr:lysozyme [Bradyrhizobium sp.]HZR77346.1 lysozyme [Bradyrhizobium sp.]
MKKSAKATAGAGAILLALSFLQPWEGLWTTAKVDTIGTGDPPTVCYGATRAEIPDLKPGDKYTKAQCIALLKKSLPKYWAGIADCIHVDLPDGAQAALISASYNAGPKAVCRSPMVERMNAGDLFGGCDAFSGWYVRAKGRVVQGLVNRRNAEKALCLHKPKSQPLPWWKQIFLKLKGIPYVRMG